MVSNPHYKPRPAPSTDFLDKPMNTSALLTRQAALLLETCNRTIDRLVRCCTFRLWSRPSLERLLHDVVVCGVECGHFRVEIEIARRTLLERLGIDTPYAMDCKVVTLDSIPDTGTNRISCLFALAADPNGAADLTNAHGCEAFFDETHPAHDEVTRAVSRLRLVFRAMAACRFRRLSTTIDRDTMTAHDLIRRETALAALDLI